MLCESREHGIYFVMSYASISARRIVSTDFLPSLSLPSSFLSHYVALWVPFLCLLFTHSSVVAACHSTRLCALMCLVFILYF